MEELQGEVVLGSVRVKVQLRGGRLVVTLPSDFECVVQYNYTDSSKVIQRYVSIFFLFHLLYFVFLVCFSVKLFLQKLLCAQGEKKIKKRKRDNCINQVGHIDPYVGDKIDNYVSCETPSKKRRKKKLITLIESGYPFDFSILSLPNEILHHIFLNLPLKTVAILNSVCRQWRAIADDDSLWRMLFDRHFGCSPFLLSSWKSRAAHAYK